MLKSKLSKSTSALGPVTDTLLSDFAQRALRGYGTFVLLDRAVADVRDGLKPVQRRILWGMHALKQGSSYKKSAKIVGDVMGNFHPHGDKAIYDTLVNMVWDRYPLIEGRGNFGSPTDNAASLRYTEARLSSFAEEVFKDVDVAQLVPNYSGDKEEPLVLPTRVPLLLLNGTSGIGVGLKAGIPPHNLGELIKIIVYCLKRSDPNISTVVKHMPGPDYGHGILTSTREDVAALYASGSGTLRFRCDYEFRSSKSGAELLVKSVAPGFNMSNFLLKMRELSESNLIDYCSDATSSGGVRIHIGFSDSSVIKDRVIPELHTTQNYQFYVVKRSPEEDAVLSSENLFSCNLLELIQQFLDFRRLVETDRLNLELKNLKRELLRAKAVLAAIQSLDKVYDVLSRAHGNLTELRTELASVLNISEKQAQIVLDLKVHRLARMNEQDQLSTIAELREAIVKVKEDLLDVDGVIGRHLKELLVFSDARGTRLEEECPEPRLKIEAQEKYVVVQGTKLFRHDKELTRRSRFDLITKSVSSVTVVLSNNEAKTIPLSFLTEEVLAHSPVGLFGDSTTAIVALDVGGLSVTCTLPSKSSFNLIKGATELKQAVGLSPDSYLVALAESGVGKLIPYGSLELTRPFVKGKKLFCPTEAGKSRSKISKIFSLSPGTELYDAKGNCLTCEGLEFFVCKGACFILGERNFVLTKDGRKDFLELAEVRTLLRNGQVQEAWVIR